jgi:MFS family permease
MNPKTPQSAPGDQPTTSEVATLRSRRLPRNVVALGLVSLFNDASSEIIYPLLPLFLTGTLGASVQLLGLIEGVTESISSLLKLPAGWLSDRVGKRKWLIVFGYGLASAVRPLLAVTSTAWQVLSLRFIDRLGKGIRSAPRDALLADSINPARRGLAFGFHRALDHAGAIIGALLSSWLFGFFSGNYRHVFWAATLPALAALLILLFAVREERRGDEIDQSPSRHVSASLGQSFSLAPFNANFKRYLAVLLLFTLGNASDAFLLLRAQQLGVQVMLIPLLWAALHVSKSVCSMIGGELSDRYGRKRLIVGGWLVYAAIYLGFAYATTTVEIWVLFILYGIYFGLTEGVEKALVADLTEPARRGTAYGFYNLVIGLGALPASLLMGFLWTRFGAAVALGVGASLSLLAALLLVSFVAERRQLA